MCMVTYVFIFLFACSFAFDRVAGTNPVEFTVMTMDPSSDPDPVTAIFNLTALDNDIVEDQNPNITSEKINITICIGRFKFTYCRYSSTSDNGSTVMNQPMDQTNFLLEAPNLPACTNLTAMITVERSSETSNGTVLQFSTSEPSMPISVGLYSMMPDYPAGSNISLQCIWNTSVYYVAWYKNGTLIYEEDLAAPSILMAPPQGVTVDSNYTVMTSNLTIDSAALDDSSNYTCAVTCGARGVEFGVIAGNLQDTTEVFVNAAIERNVFSTSTTDGSSTSATDVSSTSATDVSSTSATDVSSTSATDVSSTSATDVSSTSATDVSSTSATDVSSTSATDVFSTSATDVSSTSATDVSSTSATDVSSTSATDVSSTSATDASSTSNTDVSSTSTTDASSTSATDVSSTSATDVSSTSATSLSSAAPSPTSVAAYCVEESVFSNRLEDFLVWPQTLVGQIAEIPCFCQALPDLLTAVATRSCNASGNWEEPNDVGCALSSAVLQICNGSTDDGALLNRVSEAANNPSTLTSGDIGIISNILVNVTVESLQNDTVRNQTLDTLSNILSAEDALADIGQSSNTGSRVITTLENIANSINISSGETLEVRTTTQYTLSVSAVAAETVGGEGFMIRSTLESEITATLPVALFGQFPGSSVVRISVSTITTVALFPSTTGENIASAIFSVDVDLAEIVNLSEPIEMCIPADFGTTGQGPSCRFWDILANAGRGAWSSSGCRMAGYCASGVVRCQCDHLTSFAVLNVDVEPQPPGPPAGYTIPVAAIVVPVILAVLIALGVVGIGVAFVVYNRKRKQGKVYFTEQPGENEAEVRGNTNEDTEF